MRIGLYVWVGTVMISGCAAQSASYYFAKNGQKVYLEPVREVPTLQRSNDTRYYVFRTSRGSTVRTDGSLLVGCQEEKTRCQKVLRALGVAAAQKIASGIYLVHPKKGDDFLALARRLHADKRITFAHPNFVKKIQKR